MLADSSNLPRVILECQTLSLRFRVGIRMQQVVELALNEGLSSAKKNLKPNPKPQALNPKPLLIAWSPNFCNHMLADVDVRSFLLW